MANLRKDLKLFVRRDGSGRIVESSAIRRKKKPGFGRWEEVTVPDCCSNTTTTTTTVEDRN